MFVLAALPSSLRGYYRHGLSGRFFRIGGAHPTYLLLMSRDDPAATYSSVCALAVPGHALVPPFRDAMGRLGSQWAPPPGSTTSSSVDDVADGYVVSAVALGSHVLLEVSHYAGGGVRDSKPPAPALVH